MTESGASGLHWLAVVRPVCVHQNGSDLVVGGDLLDAGLGSLPVVIPCLLHGQVLLAFVNGRVLHEFG